MLKIFGLGMVRNLVLDVVQQWYKADIVTIKDNIKFTPKLFWRLPKRLSPYAIHSTSRTLD